MNLGGTRMIRNISYEILDKRNVTTDILLRFRDNEVTKEQYNFLNDQLDNFILDGDSKYSVAIDMNYDEFKKILIIRLILCIPDKPEDVNLEQIINTHSYNFIEAYEKDMKLYNNKLNNKSQ